MSLQVLAKQLAAKGRNGDTTLVHMSRDEVKGLAALARANGETLTINPETGLPEAFKLGNVLKAAAPIAAGFALGPAGFGLFSSALGAGLAVGGAYTLATGSLEKGLMAGLGAYGGSALGGGSLLGGGAGAAGAGATGASAATPAAGSLTAPSLSSVGSTANMAGASNALASGSSLVPAGAGSSFGLGATGAANTGLALSPTTTMAATAPGIAGTAPAIAPSGGFMTTAGNFIKNNPWQAAATLGLPLAAGAGLFDQPRLNAAAQDKGMIRPYQFERTQRPEAYARAPRDSSEQMYFNDRFTPMPAYQAAEGGQVPQLQRMPNGGLAAIEGIRDGYGARQTVDGNIPQYASGGISTLGDYSDGGRLLKGPGDGVSDDIPATINNKQPARLADGEFVVPARIVSELGNGSTDAGARKLYDMMDRVEQHRRKSVGKGKIAKDTKAYKALPA